MQRSVDWLVRRMRDRGHSIEGLHGAMSQDVRNRVMEGFRHGNTRLLVATNVAARGIDVADVGLVLNYDIPQSPEEYVHRIGRTGRMGKNGVAVSFVGQWEMEAFDIVQKHVGMAIRREELPFYSDDTEEIAAQASRPEVSPAEDAGETAEAPAVTSIARDLPGEKRAPRSLPGEKIGGIRQE
jgi:ATP-dependent RNA helicase DeaD